MASERKIKLTLDGEKEFKSALASINSQTKALNSEMKAVTSSFDKNTTAEEKNARQMDVLAKAQDAYQKKLDLLNDRIKERTEKYGENSDYVNKLKKQYFDTEAEMNKMAKAVQNTGEAMDDAGKSTGVFGDVLKANLLSEAITKGLEFMASKLIEIGKQMVQLGLDTIALADDLNTLSATTGLSTEKIQEFRYASAFLDVEESTLTGSLTRLTRNMYNAGQGTGSAAEAFKTLGVSIKNSDGSLRDSYDVFLDIVDALGGIDDEVTRDGLAMTIFGKSAQQLNPLIKAGSGALSEYRQQAHEVGYVMDQELLDSLNGVNDEYDRMKLQMEALKNQLGAELAPVIHEAILAFQEMAGAVDWAVVGQVIYVALMTVVGAFQAAFVIVNSVIGVFGWLAETFERLPGKVSAMSEAVSTKIREMKQAIADKFQEIIDGALNWGRDMVQGFINGIQQKIGEFKRKISELANTVRGYLHFSRPDEGPLRDYEQWMPDMVEGLARTLTASSYKLENAVAGMAGGMAAGMTMNLGGITINGVADESQIDRMVNQIERKLGQRLYR